MTAVQLLRKARAKLVRDGWRQKRYGSLDGPCCAVGALNYSAGSSVGMTCDLPDANRGAWATAFYVLVKALPEGEAVVAAYNDRPTTTKAKVLALFTRAIKLATKRKAVRP